MISDANCTLITCCAHRRRRVPRQRIRCSCTQRATRYTPCPPARPCRSLRAAHVGTRQVPGDAPEQALPCTRALDGHLGERNALRVGSQRRRLEDLVHLCAAAGRGVRQRRAGGGGVQRPRSCSRDAYAPAEAEAPCPQGGSGGRAAAQTAPHTRPSPAHTCSCVKCAYSACAALVACSMAFIAAKSASGGGSRISGAGILRAACGVAAGVWQACVSARSRRAWAQLGPVQAACPRRNRLRHKRAPRVGARETHRT